jgi:hypothetical protein
MSTPIPLPNQGKVYHRNVQELQKIDVHYNGPRITGYHPETNYDARNGRLPSVYDGRLHDSNMYLMYDSTFYITGIIACTTLLITGVIIISTSNTPSVASS